MKMMARTSRAEKERYLQLLEEKARRQDILYWLQGKVTENGIPITLHQHEFQKAIWEDFAETIYVRKAAQIGVSTIFILKCIYLLQRYGYNIIYTLPTLMNDVNKFVPSKVDPIAEGNGFKFSKDSTQQKQMGKGFWFFGGTFSEKEGIMTAADLLVHDEVDRSNLDVIGTYKSRLGHSQYRRRWFFSNPSAPKRGVDDGWLRSDQKHWFVTCGCGKGNFGGGRQYLDWPANVDYTGKRYVCAFCGRHITDEMRQKGEWVAKYPDREISGYWVSQMMAPWIPASSLIEDELNESQAYFHNFVLGLPYVGADINITREIILRNLSDARPATSETFIGVDVGAELHVVIGNREGIFKVVATNWDGLDALWNLYDPRQAVIDAHPEITKAKEFRAKHPNRVKLCYYLPPRPTAQKSEDTYTVDYDKQIVQAHRTEVIDKVIGEFVDGKVRVFIDPSTPALVGGVKRGESYVEHWESLYLMHDEDRDIKTWEHSGPDHYAHATVYYWLARAIAGPLQQYEVRKQ